jgi:broad specificity phosphatase PhoE
MENYLSVSPPGGESLTELSARVRAWYYSHENATFPRQRRRAWRICVTHAGVLRALKVLLEDVTWPEALAWRVPHAEVIDFRR